MFGFLIVPYKRGPMAQFWQKAPHGEIDPPRAAFLCGCDPRQCGAHGQALDRGRGGWGVVKGGNISE